MKEKIRNIINWIEILSAFTAGVIALSPLLFLSLSTAKRKRAKTSRFSERDTARSRGERK